jgi:hypothetical protein
MTELTCSACGKPVPADDGYRLYEPAESRVAVFCRLEHLVRWAIRGPSWGTGEAPATEGECVQCGQPAALVLVRHRGEHRIPDAFCTVEHAAEWAKAGGRWR